MDCLQVFQDCLRSYHFLHKERKLLLAVSGGIDSVVLCQLSKEAGLNFAIAHCNFGLRGAESERDEAFVRQLAEGYGVPVFMQRFDTTASAEANLVSIQ